MPRIRLRNDYRNPRAWTTLLLPCYCGRFATFRATRMTWCARLACLGSDALRFWLHYCRVTVVGASRSALDLHPLMLPASPCLASLSFSLTESILALPQDMSSTIVK